MDATEGDLLYCVGESVVRVLRVMLAFALLLPASGAQALGPQPPHHGGHNEQVQENQP